MEIPRGRKSISKVRTYYDDENGLRNCALIELLLNEKMKREGSHSGWVEMHIVHEYLYILRTLLVLFYSTSKYIRLNFDFSAAASSATLDVDVVLVAASCSCTAVTGVVARGRTNSTAAARVRHAAACFFILFYKYPTTLFRYSCLYFLFSRPSPTYIFI